MSRIHLSAPPAFGFVGPKVNADEAGRALGKGHHTLRKIADNGLKSAGYIPIIGIVSGVVRIWRAVFSEYKPSSPNLSLAGHIFRGGVEMIGLGSVFLPFDLVTTIYRRFFKDPASPQTPEIGLRLPKESAGLTENPVTAGRMTVAGSNNVSSDDGVPKVEPKIDLVVPTDPLPVSPNKGTRVESTDDSSENSSTETTSEEVIPLGPQKSQQPVNEPPPPEIGEFLLRLSGRNHYFATNVRFGDTFAEDIYREVVKNDRTYENKRLGVLFEARLLDEQGKICGEFPPICNTTVLHVVNLMEVDVKNAAKI